MDDPTLAPFFAPIVAVHFHPRMGISTTKSYLHTIDAAIYDAVEALNESQKKESEKNEMVP